MQIVKNRTCVVEKDFLHVTQMPTAQKRSHSICQKRRISGDPNGKPLFQTLIAKLLPKPVTNSYLTIGHFIRATLRLLHPSLSVFQFSRFPSANNQKYLFQARIGYLYIRTVVGAESKGLQTTGLIFLTVQARSRHIFRVAQTISLESRPAIMNSRRQFFLAATLVVVTVMCLTACRPANVSNKVRAELTWKGEHILDSLEDETLQSVEWLESRQKAQMATADQFDVFYDFRFYDYRPESGIEFHHYAVDCSRIAYKPVHYNHGNGIAIADIDNDGMLDIYFLTQVGSNQLWRNVQYGAFENVTEVTGVAVNDRVSVSASFADIDNDGDVDLYVTTVRGGNILYENNGKGIFTDISAKSGLDYTGHSSSAEFFDYDRDGLLDMFLTNVGSYTTDELIPATGIDDDNEYLYHVGVDDGFAGHLKPERTEKSILFRNIGENRFEDVSEQVELVDTGWSGDASPIDVNNDGWIDLYVLNMQGHDEYYENDQGKRFIRKSRAVFPKTPWGAMGIKVFDYNNDMHMDIFITDMHSDMSQSVSPDKEKEKAEMIWAESFLLSEDNSIYGNAFYRGAESGSFDEISDQIGAENYWPWGLSVGDLNADGFVDVFIASSMNYPYRYGVNSVLLNNQGQNFLDSEFILGIEPRRDGRVAALSFQFNTAKDKVAGEAKPLLEEIVKDRSGIIDVWGTLGSRASVIFDLDDDGDLDIVTNDFHSEPMVLISNLTDQKENVYFLKVQLVGTESNRDGLGARVTVHTESGVYSKIHDGQSGYLSQSSYPLYFGLGEADAVTKIEVTWPSGKQQTVSEGIQTNSLLTITEQ